MEYRTLGGTGMKVSYFCLGAMMFGPMGNPDHNECVKITHAALDAGVNFIDTSDSYSDGESERILAKALNIVQTADRPNGGVMFDTWHHFRAGGTSAELRQLSGRAIAAIQFNDAAREPSADLLTETVTARLLPGEGAIDLVGRIFRR